MVEEMLAARGILVSYETVRQWAVKFGQRFMSIKSVGACSHQETDGNSTRSQSASQIRKHWLWWDLDQHGAVLDILVQSRRDAKAAKRLLRKLLKKKGMPRVVIADKLPSYDAAKREIMPGVEHSQRRAKQ